MQNKFHDELVFSSLIKSICLSLGLSHENSLKVLALSKLIFGRQYQQIPRIQKEELDTNKNVSVMNNLPNDEVEKTLMKQSNLQNFSTSAIEKNIANREYDLAWQNDSIFQKYQLKIKYTKELSRFKCPAISNSTNYKYAKRNHTENIVYFQCHQYKNNQCLATCQIHLNQHKQQEFKIEDANTPQGIKKYSKDLALSNPTLSSQEIFNEIIKSNTNYFKVLKGWCQLLTICIRDGEPSLYLPVCDVLLSQKSERLYIEVLEQAKEVIQKYNDNDFEINTFTYDFAVLIKIILLCLEQYLKQQRKRFNQCSKIYFPSL